MSIPFAADGDMDDLPRTLRREKEARQREAREREAQASGLTAPQPDPLGYGPAASENYAGRYPASEANPATVTAFDVPFLRLAAFFIKAAFAAIPGLLILGVLLWLAGQALEIAFPELLKMKILITFPNS